jgi:hypothetical protein
LNSLKSAIDASLVDMLLVFRIFLKKITPTIRRCLGKKKKKKFKRCKKNLRKIAKFQEGNTKLLQN